ncbi:MAG: TolC family protein, partial [Desulfobacterales bacterium]|nr:TolC family protein [Desulfobacterales bacterium]
MEFIKDKQVKPGPLSWFLLLLLLPLASGCLGGDRGRVPLPLPQHLTAAPSAPALEITQSLLDLVKDPLARDLVREAVENNYNLRATALRLKASGLLLARTGSAPLPTLNGGYAGSRLNPGSDGGSQGQHKISLSLSWELDIWGKLADQHQGALDGVRAGALDWERAMDSLAARVVQSYYQVKGNQLRVGAQTRRVAIFQAIETTILEKYKMGLGNLNDFSSARSRTETARAALVKARESLDRSLGDLEVLLGRYPGRNLAIAGDWPMVAAPAPTAPAEILLNRPDVRAARARVDAADSTASAQGKA